MSARALWLAPLLACGTRGATPGTAPAEPGWPTTDLFVCGGRLASYHATHADGGLRHAVDLRCEGARGPIVTVTWVNAQGASIEDARPISTQAFTATWQALDGIGWRDLDDCLSDAPDVPDAPDAPDAPVPPEALASPLHYAFALGNAEVSQGFACQAANLAYPYSVVRDELDRRARSAGLTPGRAPA